MVTIVTKHLRRDRFCWILDIKLQAPEYSQSILPILHKRSSVS
uniref:Uncharacterized protein n=1 Tax=Arundo donax TaxID=35708 RepID=A0A0A9A6M7_ARUDO